MYGISIYFKDIAQPSGFYSDVDDILYYDLKFEDYKMEQRKNEILIFIEEMEVKFFEIKPIKDLLQKLNLSLVIDTQNDYEINYRVIEIPNQVLETQTTQTTQTTSQSQSKQYSVLFKLDPKISKSAQYKDLSYDIDDEIYYEVILQSSKLSSSQYSISSESNQDFSFIIKTDQLDIFNGITNQLLSRVLVKFDLKIIDVKKSSDGSSTTLLLTTNLQESVSPPGQAVTEEVIKPTTTVNSPRNPFKTLLNFEFDKSLQNLSSYKNVVYDFDDAIYDDFIYSSDDLVSDDYDYFRKNGNNFSIEIYNEDLSTKVNEVYINNISKKLNLNFELIQKSEGKKNYVITQVSQQPQPQGEKTIIERLSILEKVVAELVQKVN